MTDKPRPDYLRLVHTNAATPASKPLAPPVPVVERCIFPDLKRLDVSSSLATQRLRRAMGRTDIMVTPVDDVALHQWKMATNGNDIYGWDDMFREEVKTRSCFGYAVYSHQKICGLSLMTLQERNRVEKIGEPPVLRRDLLIEEIEELPGNPIQGYVTACMAEAAVFFAGMQNVNRVVLYIMETPALMNQFEALGFKPDIFSKTCDAYLDLERQETVNWPHLLKFMQNEQNRSLCSPQPPST